MKNAPFIYLTLLAGTLSLLPLEASGGTNLNNGYTVQSVRQNYPRITLKLKNAPINRLAEQLQKACSYSLIYGQELLASNPRFSIEARDLPLDEVLEELFGNSPYAYSIDNRTVTLSKKQLNPARSYQLHGQVTDPTGEPVIGGTVMIKGTSTGVVTDADGKYAIQVKPGQTLVFNYLGMQPTEVTYQGAKRINLSMKYDQSMALDEVVVTGIFKKAKESYTGSVASVSQEDLKIYKGQNMLQTLKNIDASINFSINNLAGSNPNTLPQINIRGNSSLPTNVQEFNEGVKNSTNTPLILMDGFEISLTKLMDYNDDEIESINILKDASATAIYGSRGANGVIVVISKRPETGKLKVNLELGTNIQAPDLSSYRLLGAADKLQLELDAGLYDQPWNPITHEEYRKRYNMRLKKVLEGIDTDWLKKPVRTGVGQRYNMRLEGGNEEFRWGSSLSYNDIAGAMKGSSRRTFNGSITLMYNLKNLIFRNYTSVGFNNSEESKYGKFSTYARQQPYNAPYDEEGKLVRYFDSFYAGGTPLQNPLYDASLNTFDKSGYQEIINNFSIEWNILKELTLRGQLGISTTENTSDNFLPAEHSYFIENKEYATGEGFLRRGRYEYGRGRSTQYEGNLTLSYNKTFNDAHQLYVGLNYAIAQNRDYMHYFEAEGFSNEDMNDVMNATQYAKNGQPYGYDLLTRRISLTGNANYTFDNRYYLDLSYRMDGSSTFGSDKKYAPFWSSGIGWNLHNEKFLKDKTPFNSLRLKFSYGQTGSQQGSSTGASTVYQYLTNNKYMNWTGAVLQGLGNPDLTWQKTDQLNAGLEFGLWDNRFKGTFDLYKKNHQ